MVDAALRALTIREVRDEEAEALGRLMVAVYAGLEGFPTPEEQPAYYQMLARIADFREKPQARVLVAVEEGGALLGGVVYFGDMAAYGSGGSATRETKASGIRLLGVGRALTQACIDLAKASGNTQVILHTTQAMRTAWGLYERMGFARSEDLDFLQQGFPVFGFRLPLDADSRKEL